MNKTTKIFGIYKNGPVSGKEGMYYQILHLFSPRGNVAPDLLLKVYKQNFETEESIVTFETKDEMYKFAYHLSREEEVSAICLLSVEEYNQCSEGVYSKNEFIEAIDGKAHCIENMDYNPKRGLFGKMFS